MKYLVLHQGKIVNAFELNTSEYSLETPGCETVAVTIDSNLWQSVVDNPVGYEYQNGQVIPNDT